MQEPDPVSEATCLRARVDALEAAAAERERAFREQQAVLRAAIESFPFDFFAIDLDGRYFLQSAASKRDWGDVIGKRPEDLSFDEAMKAHWTENNRRALAGETVSGDIGLLSPSGTRFAYNVIAPILEDGRVCGVLGVNIDVTDRKRAEEALRQSEQRFRAIAETAQDSIFCKDLDRRYTLANPAMERLLNRPASAIVGARPEDLFDKDAVRAIDEVDRIAYSGRVADRESTIDVGGVPHTFHVIQVPLSDASGDVTGICGIVRDVTERKRAEQERRQLEIEREHARRLESLGVLAGGIAHDFNNLLVGVLGNAQLVLEDLPDDSPVRPCVEDILDAARRAADLSRQMLAYSGKGKIEIQAVDLNVLVLETGRLIEPSMPRQTVLRYDLAQDLPRVEGDATQFRQVVMNFIVNASEATGNRGGTVIVRTGVVEASEEYLGDTYVDDKLPSGYYVFLDVEDPGRGMDAETRSRMFDPFFTTKMAGRGLGLAAALGIIRGHRGAVKVESVPGRGTRVRVLLPSGVPKDGEVPADASPAGGLPKPATVLLVDDEAAVRKTASRMLRRAGLGVLTAVDGTDALEVFRRRIDDIDCVLLDLSMPNMDGMDTARELHFLRADLPIVLSSGYPEQDVVGQWPIPGLAAFVQKPYESPTLIAALRKALPPFAAENE